MKPRFEAICTHQYASHGWYLLDRLTGRIVERVLTRIEAEEMASQMNEEEKNERR